jgi:hypothetical protein
LGKNFDPIHKHGAFKLPLAAACVIPGEARDLAHDRGSYDFARVVQNQA